MANIAVWLLLAVASVAGDFDFPNFLNDSIMAEQSNLGGKTPLNFLSFNGSESQFMPMFTVRPSGAIVISKNESQEAYAMWYTDKQYVLEGFNVSFSWTITEKFGDGGDGVAFVVQSEGLGGPDNIKPLGAAGKGMGYSGIPYSVAIEFDMYLDPDQADPNANHVSAHSRGEAPNNADERPLAIRGSLLDSDPTISVDPFGNGGQMDDGLNHTAEIRYIVSDKPGLTRMEVYLDNRPVPTLTVRVNVGDELKLTDGYAYVGMTSATGDSYQLHEIHNWSFFGEPDITQLIPSAGPEDGKTYVMVMGANYKNYSTIQCFFDSLPTLNPDSVVPGTFRSTRQIDCIAPPHKTAYTDFTLSFKNSQPLKKTLKYFYYPPPNITSSIPLGGPTFGRTNVTVKGEGFLPFLINITSCQVGEAAVPAISMTNDTVVCSPTPALNDTTRVGMRKFDISMNSQQYTGQARDYYYYHPFQVSRFKPRGGFVGGGDHVDMLGNFTMTPELSCKFGDVVVPAIIDQPMYEKDGKTNMRCLAPPHDSGFYTLEVSGNNQQWTHEGYIYIYDANLWIWLIAGIVGFCSVLFVCMCGQCWALLWKFKDYRLLASQEYRDITGKSGMESLKDLLSAKDAEERRKIIQVLNMLKMKKKANAPGAAFNQKSRWGAAAAKALTAQRAEKMTGWDALLLGAHKPAPTDGAAAAGGGAAAAAGGGAAAERAAAAGGGGPEKRPAPGAAWGEIMRMSKEGGGAGKAGAKPSGWAKLAQAPGAGAKKDYQPLM